MPVSFEPDLLLPDLAMLLGYNTNGFAHHRLEDALAIIAELGYGSVALTLERGELDPPDRRGVAACVQRIAPLLAGSGLHVTIETGSRFILDPRRKHQPTLVSRAAADRARRVEFLKAAIDVAAGLNADSVSLWSGAADDGAGFDGAWPRLIEGLREVLDHAAARGVRLGFEPEPGMVVDTMERFGRLHREIGSPLLGLTLDVGHVYCLGDGEPGEHIRRFRDVLWNVHIEDMRRGRHEHLPFGEGDMDFPPIFAALREIGYAGPVHVELSRHSHDAVEAARRAMEFLRPLA